MANGCPALFRGHTLPDRAFMDRHIHCGMSFHASLKTFLGFMSCRVDDPGCEKCFEEQHHDDDHEWPSSKLSQGELPPHKYSEQNTEFENKIGRGELESHCRREVRPFPKHGASEGDGSVGAGGRCCSQAASHSNGSRRVVRQQSAHPFLRNYGL